MEENPSLEKAERKIELQKISGRDLTFKVGRYYVEWSPGWSSSWKDISLQVRIKTRKSYSAWVNRHNAEKVVRKLATTEAEKMWCVWSLSSMLWRCCDSHLYSFFKGRKQENLLKGVLISMGLNRTEAERIRSVWRDVKRGAELGLWSEKWIENFKQAAERALWRKVLGRDTR